MLMKFLWHALLPAGFLNWYRIPKCLHLAKIGLDSIPRRDCSSSVCCVMRSLTDSPMSHCRAGVLHTVQVWTNQARVKLWTTKTQGGAQNLVLNVYEQQNICIQRGFSGYSGPAQAAGKWYIPVRSSSWFLLLQVTLVLFDMSLNCI